jgi:outer membrane lipoprotein-sorting protein
MKKITAIFCFAILCLSVFAQTDLKAKAILDKASAKFKKVPAKVNFTMTIEDTKSEKKDIIYGDVVFKDSKFRLTVPKVQTYFDGKTQYVYMHKNNEVSLSVPTKEELQDVNPTMLLTSYSKNASVQFSLDNKPELKYNIIDVFPDFKQKKAYYKSIVKIDKKTLDVISIKVLSQSGIHTLFQINSTDVKTQYEDSYFVFDFKANSKVVVNDLR